MKRHTFEELKEATQKKRAEKEKELGYTMVDTDKARKICIGQFERNIEQVVDD